MANGGLAVCLRNGDTQTMHQRIRAVGFMRALDHQSAAQMVHAWAVHGAVANPKRHESRVFAARSPYGQWTPRLGSPMVRPKIKQRPAMTLTDLAISQFMDPFRIALLIGLVVTMQRTMVVTGKLVPLLAGIVFVAVIIPSTITQTLAASFVMQVGVGLVTNAVLLAVILGIKMLIDSRRAR